MKEKISVIVPAYNAEPFLERCVGSICGQSYENLEILIVSNGSTDRTVELAEQMAEKDSRIRVICGENEGVSVARNIAIEQATGDYLTFVDADDFLLPDMIETLYEAAKEQNCDVVGCGFTVTDGTPAGGKESAKKQGTKAVPVVISGGTFIAKRIFDGDSRCWSKLYSRKAVGETRFMPGLTIGEDMLFVLNIMQKDVRVANLEYPGYCYYRNPNGAMETAFKASYMDQIRCWQEAKKQVQPAGEELTDKINRVLLIAVMLVAGKLALANGLKKDEKKAYLAVCRETMKAFENAEYKRAHGLLDRGYRLRVSLFRHMPNIYLLLWKILKKIHAI